MAERLTFAVYDTMTSTPFSGNLTPVFILSALSAWLPEASMQLIAQELNHSETVFVRSRPDFSPNEFDIRWYTPLAEEPFCGHGVLGAAHALHAAGYGTSFNFTTFTGIQATASIVPSPLSTPKNNEHVIISLSFPSPPVLPSLALSEDVRIGFANALGTDESNILSIGQNALMDIIIEVDPNINFSARKMKTDPAALLNASPSGTRSQVITSSWNSDQGVDFAKRVFAYGSEDQATGSTYCALVPYWGERLGKTEVRCLQPSWRGGGAKLKWQAEGKVVEILAESVKTVEGSIVVPSSNGGMNGVRAKL